MGRVSERDKGSIKTLLGKAEVVQKIQSVGAYSAAFLAAFLVALVSASAFTPVDNTEAETVSATISDGCTLSVFTSDKVSMDFSATADGTVAIGSGTITTKSTCTSGYKVFMSMNTDNANGNRLYLDGDTSSSSYFIPVSGDPVTPTVPTANTWGWAIAKDSSWTDPTMSNYGFDSSYTPGISGSTTSKFAPMPLKGSEALVQASDSVSGSGGDTEDVYYGVVANSAMQSGTYLGTIVYSAVSSGQTETSETIAIAPTSGTADGGTTVTISTDIYSSMSDSQLADDFSATIGGNDCTITGFSRSSTGALKVTCTTPSSNDKLADVALTSTLFEKTWTLDDGFEYTNSTFDGITEMQQMTSAICAAETTPTKDAATTTLSANTAASDNTTYVAEAELEDTRDGKTYVVRKLADGNCWMSQNLDLDLSTSTTLSNSDTDLNSQTSWTPDHNTQPYEDETTVWGNESTATDVNQARSYDNAVWCYGGGEGRDQICSHTYDKSLMTATSSAGNLYDWYAATAGTGTYERVFESGDAPDSICPKNWQLPTSTRSTNANRYEYSYYNLMLNAYSLERRTRSGAAKTLVEPLSFVRGGWYSGTSGELRARGHFALYVTASAEGNPSYIYAHNYYNSIFEPLSNYKKIAGMSIRCVAR